VPTGIPADSLVHNELSTRGPPYNVRRVLRQAEDNSAANLRRVCKPATSTATGIERIITVAMLLSFPETLRIVQPKPASWSCFRFFVWPHRKKIWAQLCAVLGGSEVAVGTPYLGMGKIKRSRRTAFLNDCGSFALERLSRMTIRKGLGLRSERV
jgi:hypothetical protein